MMKMPGQILRQMKRPTPNLHIFAVLAAGISLCVCAGGAQAAGVPIPHGTVELVAENQWIAPGQESTLGLHFQLEKGWHIYWVNPGDSGEPPRVTWQLPAGLTAGALQWPAPQRMQTSATIVDFGYHDSVLLLVPLRASAALPGRQPVKIGAEVRVLVCREMCIPGKAQVTLTLPVQTNPPAPNPAMQKLFADARKSLPGPAPTGWKFSVEEGKDTFLLRVDTHEQVTQAFFFPLEESQIDNAAPQKLDVMATGGAKGFRLSLRKSEQLVKRLTRLKGVLALPAGPSYLVDVPITPGAGK